MGYIKQTSLVAIILALCLAFIPCASYAVGQAPQEPEENFAEKISAVSKNCTSIKRSLTQLQRVDSRTRTYLGATYETISNKFIMPLNIRLERNNHILPDLLSLQQSFISRQADFRTAYTDYMRDLESLIAIDCATHPEDFYAHLEITRARRSELQSIAIKLLELADGQYQAVTALKDSL